MEKPRFYRTLGVIFTLLSLMWAPNSVALDIGAFCRAIYLGRDVPIVYHHRITAEPEMIHEVPLVNVYERNGHRADPRVRTPDRWPTHGIPGTLDPARIDYTHPLDRQWAALKDQPVGQSLVGKLGFGIRLAVSSDVSKETFKEIQLSHDRAYAVTYSSTGVTRTYEAGTGKLLSTLPWGGWNGGYQEGIFGTTNKFFVLVQAYRESGSRHPYLTVRRFDDPTRIVAIYNLSNQSAHAVTFNRAETKMIVANLSWVTVVDLRTGFDKRIHFRERDGFISTGTLLSDEKTLVLGIKSESIKGDAHVIAIDTEFNLVSGIVTMFNMQDILSIYQTGESRERRFVVVGSRGLGKDRVINSSTTRVPVPNYGTSYYPH